MAVLDEKAKAEFAAQMRSLPEGDTGGGTESEETVETTEPVDSSIDPNAAETAGATRTDPIEDGQPPPAAEKPPQNVPYGRFKEINDKNRELLTRQADYEKRLADVDAAAKAEAAKVLRQIADNNPELRSYILGDEAPAGDAPAPAPAPAGGEQPPAAKPAAGDPTLKQLDTLTKRVGLQEQWRRRQEQEAYLDKLQEEIETAMDKHPVFKNEKAGALAQKLVGKAVLTNPNKAPGAIVDEVAAELKAYEEEVKKTYVESKRTAAKKVPVGVGGGGAAPPGQQAQKASFLDGTTKKAFAAGLKSLRDQTEG